MARLRPRYSLCPLIDQNSLLGVAEVPKSGCVVVTLGKNIIIQYKLFNQKQMKSWSSKEKLSSSVVYDEVGNQYFAIFNRNQLRIWSENEEHLDKIKKIRFEEQIHCVMTQPNGGEPLVIFRNGIVHPLSTAIENRKNKHDDSLLTSDEVIEECHLVTYETCTFITLFCRNSVHVPYFHIVPVSEEVSPVKLTLARDHLQLMGQTVTKEERSCCLLSLWSDGKLYSLAFVPLPSPAPPGTLVGVVRAVSTKHPVAMVALSPSHVAMYGADSSEEGAVLIIFNTQFGVVQSRHRFKLFASPPRLWCAGSNLLVTTARSLVVAPYELENQRLSALVGAQCNSATKEHDPDVQEVHYMQCDSWIANDSATSKPDFSDWEIPQSLKNEMQHLQVDGCPQSVIVEKLLPALLETKAASELIWCIKNFTDIPESSLAQVLHFCLENKGTTNKHGAYHELLNTVLCTAFSDVLLLQCLRRAPFDDALTLLKYLADEFEADEPAVELSSVLDWTSLLLDAHYQRFLLSGDPYVSELLCRVRKLVNDQISHVNELRGLLPLLYQLQKGKLMVKTPHFSNKLYSIEVMRLY